MENLTTSRDIRLHLASLLDELSKVQTSEAWVSVASEFPILTEQFEQANTTLDTLWFNYRCATTNPGD
ncbi:MAG: hypothetical protein KME46_33090 [Brasilonema angustatum HA4187-MV1]|jgi:hypothetical protein|nr:hypothetical protein [Brasilonema angustatum HA4187-MV1]